MQNLEEQKLAKIVEVSNNDEQFQKNKSDKSIAESKTKEEKGNIKSEVIKEKTEEKNKHYFYKKLRIKKIS